MAKRTTVQCDIPSSHRSHHMLLLVVVGCYCCFSQVGPHRSAALLDFNSIFQFNFNLIEFQFAWISILGLDTTKPCSSRRGTGAAKAAYVWFQFDLNLISIQLTPPPPHLVPCWFPGVDSRAVDVKQAELVSGRGQPCFWIHLISGTGHQALLFAAGDLFI